MNVTLGDCCTPRLDYLLKNRKTLKRQLLATVSHVVLPCKIWTCQESLHMYMCEICLVVTPLRSYTILCDLCWAESWRCSLPSVQGLQCQASHQQGLTDFFVACKLSVCLSLYKQSLFMCNYSWVCLVDLQLLGCLVPTRLRDYTRGKSLTRNWDNQALNLFCSKHTVNRIVLTSYLFMFPGWPQFSFFATRWKVSCTHNQKWSWQMAKL